MALLRKIFHASYHYPGHLLWILAAYLPFLGSMSIPLTGDQKLYLSTALEMREQGSWLKPLLWGSPSYYKPPLQYWGMLLGWKIFGFNFWGALLPSVVCVLLTAVFLSEISAFFHIRRPFINAGIFFAGTLGAATYGTTAQMEIYICCFYAASWWAGLRFLADPFDARKWRWLYLAFIGAGISALIKSPLYSVFWVAGYVSYLVISGEWELLVHRRFYLGLFLGIVLGASWYGAILWMDGKQFWMDYVLRESWNKRFGNIGSFWSLWLALIYFCFPFTLLLVPAVRNLFQGRRSNDILRFLFCWGWPPAIFFSFYPYRIKPYLLILVPALAILMDWGYYRAGRTRLFRRFLTMTGSLFLLSLVGLAWVLRHCAFQGELVRVEICLAFVLIGILAFLFSIKEQMRGFILTSLMAILVFRVALTSLGEQDIAGLRRFLSSHPEASIAMLDDTRNIWHEVGLLSVAIGRPMVRLQSEKQVEDFLGWVILSDTQHSQRPIAAIWPRWQSKSKFPYHELFFKGHELSHFQERMQRQYTIVGRE